MIGFTQILSLIFVLAALSAFAIMIIIRFNRKRIEHAGELVQKEAEKSLAIKQTAFDTQEAERKRIGEDLHDDIGPRLAMLKMQLSNVKRKHPNTAKALDPLLDQFKETISHVRKVSHDLVPNVLYELGLAESIRSISRSINHMHGLSSTCEIDDDLPEMNKKKELAVYRIIQEGVNNAIKHSEASEINIHLYLEDNHIIAKVTDDGIGMSSKKSDGIGLQNIRKRAEMFDGKLDIQSVENQGTKLLVKL